MPVLEISPNKVAPALVLDLDGAVRVSRGGHETIQGIEDVLLLPDVEERLAAFRREGLLILGLTSDASVAFGTKTAAHVAAEHKAMIDQFKNGEPFHFIMTCYHHPKGTKFPYNYRSLLQMPGPGMLAVAETYLWRHGYVIDWNNSLFVGSTQRSEECARWCEITFIHANDFFHRGGTHS